MANRRRADDILDKAKAQGTMEHLVVIGRGQDGKLQLYLDELNVEQTLLLLERVKAQLIKRLDG